MLSDIEAHTRSNRPVCAYLCCPEGTALRDAGWRGWGGLLYRAFAVTFVSYAMRYPLVRRYAANQTMPFTVPDSGVASSALILGGGVAS